MNIRDHFTLSFVCRSAPDNAFLTYTSRDHDKLDSELYKKQTRDEDDGHRDVYINENELINVCLLPCGFRGDDMTHMCTVFDSRSCDGLIAHITETKNEYTLVNGTGIDIRGNRPDLTTVELFDKRSCGMELINTISARSMQGRLSAMPLSLFKSIVDWGFVYTTFSTHSYDDACHLSQQYEHSSIQFPEYINIMERNATRIIETLP
jgi:hypothetical protein